MACNPSYQYFRILPDCYPFYQYLAASWDWVYLSLYQHTQYLQEIYVCNFRCGIWKKMHRPAKSLTVFKTKISEFIYHYRLIDSTCVTICVFNLLHLSIKVSWFHCMCTDPRTNTHDDCQRFKFAVWADTIARNQENKGVISWIQLQHPWAEVTCMGGLFLVSWGASVVGMNQSKTCLRSLYKYRSSSRKMQSRLKASWHNHTNGVTGNLNQILKEKRNRNILKIIGAQIPNAVWRRGFTVNAKLDRISNRISNAEKYSQRPKSNFSNPWKRLQAWRLLLSNSIKW